MTIEEYIKSKPKFELMPFVTVYATIMELISDGYLASKALYAGGTANVGVYKPEPSWKIRGGLHCTGDFVSRR